MFIYALLRIVSAHNVLDLWKTVLSLPLSVPSMSGVILPKRLMHVYKIIINNDDIIHSPFTCKKWFTERTAV